MKGGREGKGKREEGRGRGDKRKGRQFIFSMTVKWFYMPKTDLQEL